MKPVKIDKTWTRRALERSSADGAGRGNPLVAELDRLGDPDGCRLSMWAKDYFAGTEFLQAHVFRNVRSGVFFLGVRGVQDLVGNAQPLDWLSVHNVRFDNFVHVLGMHAAVENTLGINRHRRTQLALIEAAGFVRAHQFQSALRQLDLEQALQIALPSGIAAAARMASLALIHADENVFFEFCHRLLSRLPRYRAASTSTNCWVERSGLTNGSGTGVLTLSLR